MEGLYKVCNPPDIGKIMRAFTYVRFIRTMFSASLSLSIINAVSGLALVVLIMIARCPLAIAVGRLGGRKDLLFTGP